MVPPLSVSVIVPVNNEESILASQVEAMLAGLAQREIEHELLLVENGSADRTLAVCRRLAERNPCVRVLSLGVGDYGAALRWGIENAAHDVVIIFNVEFWSLEFVEIALAALQTRTLVIGSKLAPGAHDERPFMRRSITRGYNLLLRWGWGFDGTDTHGMKAFVRAAVLPIVKQCRCKGFVFDTELVLRCQRAGLSKLELPTDVREVRAPTTRSLAARVPGVVRNLWLLWLGMRSAKPELDS